MSAVKKRIAVAVSGAGRSLENLLTASTHKDCAYTIAGVIASRPDIRGCDIARKHHLPLLVMSFTRAQISDTELSLYEWLQNQNIEIVALAGFLKPFPVRKEWSERVINIHPALLPKYGGKGMYGHHVHEAVVAAGESQSGATVHFVNSRYDEGQIIAQVVVKLAPAPSPQEVATQVFAAECDLYPKALQGLVTGALPLTHHEIFRYAYDPK